MVFDKKISAIFESLNARILYVDLTNSINDICKLQDTNSLGNEVIAKITLNSCLIGLTIKDNDLLMFNYNGNGLIGKITAEYENFKVRSSVENPKYYTKLNNLNIDEVSGTKGYISVNRKNKNGSMFTSETEIISNSIDLNFMYFLNKSEQIKSYICTNYKINNSKFKKAIGVLIQFMPNYSDDNIDYLEEKIKSVLDFQEKIISFINPENLFSYINEDFKILEEKKIIFECSCNEEKLIAALKQIKDNIKDKKIIKSECDFCKKKYEINEELI